MGKECLVKIFSKFENCKNRASAQKILGSIPDDRLRDLVMYLHGSICCLRSERGWCPVELALPDDGKIVLVTAPNKIGLCPIHCALYSNGSWHGGGFVSDIVAWMELPVPYEGGYND